MKTTLLIDDGDVFEGDLDDFQNCFFSCPDGWSEERFLDQIADWANHEGYKFTIL